MIFHKLSGGGNDFVLFEEEAVKKANIKKLILKVCSRGLSVGADGVLFLKKRGKNEIDLKYFNSDGSQAFCGNGTRCACFYAYKNGLCESPDIIVNTAAGALAAKVKSDSVILQMPSPKNIKFFLKGKFLSRYKYTHFADTGVPHAVVFVKDVNKINVNEEGRKIRFDDIFSPKGANVNFVSKKSANTFLIRTFERGVEGETLSCGSGITAAGVLLFLLKKAKSKIKIISRSKAIFNVSIKPGKNGISEVESQGPVKIVYKGELYD